MDTFFLPGQEHWTGIALESEWENAVAKTELSEENKIKDVFFGAWTLNRNKSEIHVILQLIFDEAVKNCPIRDWNHSISEAIFQY